MPKDATKNVDRYKIRGGSLNEYDFQKEKAADKTQKAADKAQMATGKTQMAADKTKMATDRKPKKSAAVKAGKKNTSGKAAKKK